MPSQPPNPLDILIQRMVEEVLAPKLAAAVDRIFNPAQFLGQGDSGDDGAGATPRRRKRVSPAKGPIHPPPPPPKRPRAGKPPSSNASGRGSTQTHAQTYYDILEVSSKASAETIAAAYKSLARRYHPDVAGGAGATAKMQALNRAWEVLKDGKRRAEYDRQLRED